MNMVLTTFKDVGRSEESMESTADESEQVRWQRREGAREGEEKRVR
jgi:hypothetical protein